MCKFPLKRLFGLADEEIFVVWLLFRPRQPVSSPLKTEMITFLLFRVSEVISDSITEQFNLQNTWKLYNWPRRTTKTWRWPIPSWTEWSVEWQCKLPDHSVSQIEDDVNGSLLVKYDGAIPRWHLFASRQINYGTQCVSANWNNSSQCGVPHDIILPEL